MNSKPGISRRSGVGTGTTSLLMIFTVLCFATLAMLSLSTAASNQRIQDRGIRRMADTAAARGAAAAEVAALDGELLELKKQWCGEGQSAVPAATQASADEDDPAAVVDDSQAEGDGTVHTEGPVLDKEVALPPLLPSCNYLTDAIGAAARRGWETEGDTITFTTAIDEGRQLVTKIQLQDVDSEARYVLLSQTTLLTDGWTPGDDAQVWIPGQ